MRTRSHSQMSGWFTRHQRLEDYLESDDFQNIRKQQMDGLYVISGHPHDIGSRNPFGPKTRITYKIGKWTKNKTRLYHYNTVWRQEDTRIHYLWPSKPKSMHEQGTPIANRKENALRAILQRHPRVEQKAHTRDYFICTWNDMRDAIEQMEQQWVRNEHKDRVEMDRVRHSDRIRDRYMRMYQQGVDDTIEIMGVRRALSQHQLDILSERKVRAATRGLSGNLVFNAYQ